jgi:hypothetical protein
MLRKQEIEGKEKEDYSSNKLRQSCVSKMRTIMVGAICDIEEKENFDEMRKSILDRGNNLIRLLEEELKNYSIVYKSNMVIFKKEG